MRHTVGGAQKVVTPWSTMAFSSGRAANGRWFSATTVASAFQGANSELQACFAQPGAETLRCTSPGRRPSQYIVDRCPTG